VGFDCCMVCCCVLTIRVDGIVFVKPPLQTISILRNRQRLPWFLMITEVYTVLLVCSKAKQACADMTTRTWPSGPCPAEAGGAGGRQCSPLQRCLTSSLQPHSVSLSLSSCLSLSRSPE